jgi:hypothetical protein
MFFRIDWHPGTDRGSALTGLLPLEPSVGAGVGIAFCNEQGGGVAAVFEPFCQELVSFVRGVSYVQSLDYAGIALLSEWLKELEPILPNVPATVRLTVSAIPSKLVASGTPVWRMVGNLGFDVRLRGRTLELAKQTTPLEAVREFRLLAFALDHEGRTLVGDGVRTEINSISLEHFGVSSEFARLTELISESRGRRALDRLLQREEVSGQRRREVGRSDEFDLSAGTISRLLDGFTVDVGKKISIDASQVEPMLENFLRFSVDPRWLIYLPPAMASVQCSRGEYLEHPDEVFSYFRDVGISKVVMEYKHMGSRAIVIVCQSEAVAERRFGFKSQQNPGCVYTRNGRAFFTDSNEEKAFLLRVQASLTEQGFWKRWKTDWVLLDGEILPWSLKAEGLIEDRHGDVLGAARATLQEACSTFASLPGTEQIQDALKRRWRCIDGYAALYERYSAERGRPIQFAPFQILATENRTYCDRNHVWHMDVLAGISRRSDGVMIVTPFQSVDLYKDEACLNATAWWKRITEQLEEGVVIKPMAVISTGRRGGTVQPGVKCRGREHLRLVYGPEYDRNEYLEALRERSAFSHRRQKHRGVLRQFALSLEAVKRFVQSESVDRIQECVVGIAALERSPQIGDGF